MEILGGVSVIEELFEMDHTVAEENVNYDDEATLEALLVPPDPLLPLVSLRMFRMEQRGLLGQI